MRLKQIYLKNFRCFTEKTFDLDSNVIIIQGQNGVGKTSLVEAIHYLCYMKSFRTRHNAELASLNTDTTFFVRGVIAKEHTHDLQTKHTISVGFASNKKRVRIDDAVIGSYKELFAYYQVVTVTDADIDIIRSGPACRRSFLDEVALLNNYDYVEVLRAYKDVVAQKNALLRSKSYDEIQHTVWTKKLFSLSAHMVAQRMQAIEILHYHVKELCREYQIPEYDVSIQYQAKQEYSDFNEGSQFLIREKIMGRSLAGAHLDEVFVDMLCKNMRTFGSRGQQKLATLLLKIAQVRYLVSKGQRPIFVLDDFVTDFDTSKLSLALRIIESLPVQVIFTTPLDTNMLFGSSDAASAQIIRL